MHAMLTKNQLSRYSKFEQISSHIWFKDFNWDKIREMKPPFIPQLDYDWDTKYFDDNTLFLTILLVFE